MSVIDSKPLSGSTPAVKMAKLFMNGRSQAVRLPKEFRFEGTEVAIRRDPATGEVTISRPAVQPAKTQQKSIAEWDALGSGADSTRRLTLPELYAIFDRADFPDDFFKRESHMPRELDLF
jgi:antitoxin VapB